MRSWLVQFLRCLWVVAFAGIAIDSLLAEDAEQVSQENGEKEERLVEPEKAKSDSPKQRKRKSREERPPPRPLTPEERIRMQQNMGDVDLYGKEGVAYRKSWGFRSGVTRLYPPFYEDWVNGGAEKGVYEHFSGAGLPGHTLSAVLYDKRFYKETGSEFINFYALIWTPEEYAFSLLGESGFGAVKDRLREQIIELRKERADRDQFESFQDYVAFKFGRDDEIENFVDGYWIEANEGGTHLTYFYTSEFKFSKKKEAFVRPLIATSSFLIVRNKLLKIDIVRVYQSQEDVAKLLQFTERFREDMAIANSHEGRDPRK